MNTKHLPQAAVLLLGGFVGGLCATSLVGVDAAPSAAPATVLLPQDTGGGLPAIPTFATADSNGSMIAVTGVDITGSSVLYLIDTEREQLACYQATGGASSTQGVKLVGARRIDLDLQLHGYNDDSEYDYRALEREFSGLESE